MRGRVHMRVCRVAQVVFQKILTELLAACVPLDLQDVVIIRLD